MIGLSMDRVLSLLRRLGQPLVAKTWSPWAALLCVNLWLLCFGNTTFYQRVLQDYPLNAGHLVELATLPLVLAGVISVLVGVFTALVTLASPARAFRLTLVFLLITAAVCAHFMDSTHVVIDNEMLENVFKTNGRESKELLTLTFGWKVLLFGVFPSVLAWKLRLPTFSRGRQLWWSLKFIFVGLVLALVFILGFSRFYASFFREHKPLRYYTNPTYPIYSMGKWLGDNWPKPKIERVTLGEDAKVYRGDGRHRLVIFVAGETARADHFSLNGYHRMTNPKLSQRNIVNFPNFRSSFTSTAQSLPCMFSVYGAEDYNRDKALNTDNLLDIFSRTGAAVLWRDNNTGSQHIADRVLFQDFTKKDLNPVVESGETLDEGLLSGLQDFIDEHRHKDVFIVLHQLGNHGPAYYKRYPKAFEQFKPVQTSNDLNACSVESIVNAFDNAILYTDHVLSQVIDLLEHNQEHHDVAMFYVSDHGESLGEGGIYLHGLPNFMAPEAQRHVPAVVWLGREMKRERSQAEKAALQSWNHDALFHSMLGLMRVSTSVYQRELDIFQGQDLIANPR